MFQNEPKRIGSAQKLRKDFFLNTRGCILLYFLKRMQKKTHSAQLKLSETENGYLRALWWKATILHPSKGKVINLFNQSYSINLLFFRMVTLFA